MKAATTKAAFEQAAQAAADTGATIYEDAIPDWAGCPRAWKPYSKADRAFDRLVAQHVTASHRNEDQRLEREAEERRKALVGEDAAWRKGARRGWDAAIHGVVVNLQRVERGRYQLDIGYHYDGDHRLDVDRPIIEAPDAAKARDLAARHAARHLVGRIEARA